MLALIDNYDSFTWNLWHFLCDMGAQVEVVRNDAASAEEIVSREPKGIIISPGPGVPQGAGMSIELVKQAAGRLPVLGVCLGHQAIAAAFGGEIARSDPPVHGKLSLVERVRANEVASDVLADCPQHFPVTRYHSLVVDEASLPGELTVTARTKAGTIMAISHREHEIHGVQFHPESIASVAGYRILANFMRICGIETPGRDAIEALESQLLRLDERFPDQMHP